MVMVGLFVSATVAGPVAMARAPRLPREVGASELAGVLHPSSHRIGHTRVVHLWASWCRPCTSELPALLDSLKSARRTADAVFVSLDDADGSALAAKAMAKAGGATGIQLRAASEAALAAVKDFDPEWDGSIPTTYVLDGKGHLLAAQRGYTDLRALGALINQEEEGR
jgi:thiol-disulfide isomerase/thioredoxin